ncbi:hypothetical protein Pse7367_0159 [Thalassoporum mexicanum PCC 7367]|nr:hypothetical protein Pse7367_0159 [Pseudanabaena sp. PCC 7367]
MVLFGDRYFTKRSFEPDYGRALARKPLQPWLEQILSSAWRHNVIGVTIAIILIKSIQQYLNISRQQEY